MTTLRCEKPATRCYILLQYTELKRQAEMEKERVREFPEMMARRTESHTRELVGKQETLGDLQKELSVLVRKYHIVDILSQHRNNLKQITEAKGQEAGSCDILKTMTAAPTGKAYMYISIAAIRIC